MTVASKLYVPNVADYLALGLDRIDWERSEIAVSGPFYPLRATAAGAATLTGTGAAPFTLNGLDFKVTVAGTLCTASFTDPDPYTLADALIFINAALTGATATGSGGKVLLTTTDTGTDATLLIGSGTANTELGFTALQHSWGVDTYTALLAGTYNYTDYDLSGEAGFWYRYRYISSTTGDYTEWFDVIQATEEMIVDLTEVCLCWVKVADLDGTGYDGIEVLIVNPTSAENVALSSSGYAIVGPRIVLTTNTNGYAETYLPRGATIDISIEGTSLIRRITLPTDEDSVNLLDSTFGTGDLFDVKTFNIPGAIRRTI